MNVYKVVLTDGLSEYNKYIPAINFDFAVFTAKDLLEEFKKGISHDDDCEILAVEIDCTLENLVRLELGSRYQPKKGVEEAYPSSSKPYFERQSIQDKNIAQKEKP